MPSMRLNGGNSHYSEYKTGMLVHPYGDSIVVYVNETLLKVLFARYIIGKVLLLI